MNSNELTWIWIRSNGRRPWNARALSYGRLLNQGYLWQGSTFRRGMCLLRQSRWLIGVLHSKYLPYSGKDSGYSETLYFCLRQGVHWTIGLVVRDHRQHHQLAISILDFRFGRPLMTSVGCSLWFGEEVLIYWLYLQLIEGLVALVDLWVRSNIQNTTFYLPFFPR